MDKYVVDAGPLIHLDQINRLEIIQKLHSIIIPPSVIQEIRHDSSGSEIKTIGKWNNIRIISPEKYASAATAIFKKFPFHH